ncbi:MAG: DNA N-6-adenine-methyltransferase [Anaerolineae bacterium]|jgi:ParB family chromosome partitioning protein|nr:DNA N-6-adenine-methyltransferase [Anaerolineae bacterium]
MQSKQRDMDDLYAGLDIETRIVVQQRTGEIKTLMQRTAQDLIEIGQKLVEVKVRLGHGLFGAWLHAEFEWSERTAQRYMSVAQAFKSDTVSVLANAEAKALYLLAAPSTPEIVREDAVQRAEAGERLTYNTAREMVQEHKHLYSAPSLRPSVCQAKSGPLLAETSDTPISAVPGYDGDEWYTPVEYLEAARAVMGDIDLDPASCAAAQEVVQAKVFFTKEDDGLAREWRGQIWLNPPYSAALAPRFIDKLCAEYDAGRLDEAVVLVNNATDTAWFHNLLGRFPACFLRKRVPFWRPGHNGGGARQGQVIFYLGPKVSEFWRVFSLLGVVVWAIFDAQATGENVPCVRSGGSVGSVRGIVGLGL